MTRLRFVPAAWWFCFGVYLVVTGTAAALSWHYDPFFSGMSLRWWHSTNIIPGAVGIAYAVALAAKWRFYSVPGYIVGAFFVLDNSFVLAITTNEGRMSIGGAWSAFVIVVSLATIAFNFRLARDVRRPPPEAWRQGR